MQPPLLQSITVPTCGARGMPSSSKRLAARESWRTAPRLAGATWAVAEAKVVAVGETEIEEADVREGESRVAVEGDGGGDA